MEKKLFFSLNFLLLVITLNAQEVSKVKDNLFRINILNPGLTFEKAVGRKETLCLDANLSLTYTTSVATGIAKTPFVRLQFREYYNLNRRIAKNKNILNNSGNYIALNNSYYFKTINDNDFIYIDDGFNIGTTWGMQRTYKSGLNINFNTGLGYNFSTRRKQFFHPIINFTIGWVIFEKKK